MTDETTEHQGMIIAVTTRSSDHSDDQTSR